MVSGECRERQGDALCDWLQRCTPHAALHHHRRILVDVLRARLSLSSLCRSQGVGRERLRLRPSAGACPSRARAPLHSHLCWLSGRPPIWPACSHPSVVIHTRHSTRTRQQRVAEERSNQRKEKKRNKKNRKRKKNKKTKRNKQNERSSQSAHSRMVEGTRSPNEHTHTAG